LLQTKKVEASSKNIGVTRKNQGCTWFGLTWKLDQGNPPVLGDLEENDKKIQRPWGQFKSMLTVQKNKY